MGNLFANLQHPQNAVDDSGDIELRGVSVFYLSNTLAAEVKAAGFSHETSIAELEPVVIRQKGENIYCPRDGHLGAAYVDALQGDDSVGRATHMLSYSWKYSMLGEVIPSLEQYCLQHGLNPKRTYVWICCLCINQHRVIEQRRNGKDVPFEEFQKTFADRVDKIGHILALMTPCHEPVYLKRVWCVFEIFTAIVGGKGLDILMPPSQRASLRTAMLAEADPNTSPEDEIYNALINVDIERADASVPADKERIVDIIRNSNQFGIEELNLKVKSYLKTWFMETVKAESKGLLRDPSVSLQQKANLCSNITNMLFDNCDCEAAEVLLKEGMNVVAAHGMEEAVVGAQILTEIAILYLKQNNVKASIASFERALQIYKQCDAFHSEAGAALCNVYGSALRKNNDLEAALAVFMQGRKILIDLHTNESVDDANLIGNIAYVNFLQGHNDAAEKWYVHACEIYERTKTLETVSGALLLASMGALKERQGNKGQAGHFYQKAKAIREQTCTLDTPAGELLISWIDRLMACEGDRDGTCPSLLTSKGPQKVESF